MSARTINQRFDSDSRPESACGSMDIMLLQLRSLHVDFHINDEASAHGIVCVVEGGRQRLE